jgi:hypothetical protein
MHFRTLDLTESYMLNRSQYGTITGTKHIKTIFRSSPVTENHFTGNAFCSSDDSITKLIHVLHIFTINIVFYIRPREKNPEESNLENEGTRE